MSKFKTCQYEDCDAKVYARGYCRRHYNMLWRKGSVGRAHALSEDEKGLRMDQIERLRSLERELKRAKQMYKVVCGIEGRVKWHREIVMVGNEIEKLKVGACVESVNLDMEDIDIDDEDDDIEIEVPARKSGRRKAQTSI